MTLLLAAIAHQAIVDFQDAEDSPHFESAAVFLETAGLLRPDGTVGRARLDDLLSAEDWQGEGKPAYRTTAQAWLRIGEPVPGSRREVDRPREI